ncbi:MAG: glycosyltransferase [Verrucomicrobiaceae bacterium]|nr:glycosyltransferase [Verrucomicrobiaceae bacterium]
MATVWIIVLLIAAFVLFMAYPGYPLLLALLPRPNVKPPLANDTPVSVVLVAKNESNRIESRIANLQASEHPIQEIILVCDGCTDETANLARARGAKVIEQPVSKGKPAGVNAGVAAASSEIVVLCDARQRFEHSTIRNLARWFSDSSTGAVSGALEIETAGTAQGRGVDAYWKLEKFIRRVESDLDSSVGCTGAVYAVRRTSFVPMPDDTILDDVVVPMEIAKRGDRVRFDPEALAYDPQQLDGAKELNRKVRTLAGNFQMMARYPEWMLPWGHRLWWKLICHKYLRLTGPVALALMIVATFALQPLVAWVLWGTFFGLAMLGRWKPSLVKAVSLPSGFVFLQWCIVRGFFYWLNRAEGGAWK